MSRSWSPGDAILVPLCLDVTIKGNAGLKEIANSELQSNGTPGSQKISASWAQVLGDPNK